jgi:hypothetical protein
MLKRQRASNLIRLKKRGLWFLLGTPLILFWFFVPPE